MNLKSIMECESKSIQKMKKYQLSNSFKKVGIAILILSFLGIFLNVLLLELDSVKMLCKYGILMGLLIISVSKEKIEDELVSNLRMQSYTFAFIGGVFLTITNPFATFVVNFFFDKQQYVFKGIGDWQILWILLSIQVFYFEFLKRFHR